ncbi:MAG: cation diffusion facilitator family transporter [Kiloniellales bacterium]
MPTDTQTRVHAPSPGPGQTAEAKRLLHLVTWASVGTATFLVVLKLYAWSATDSISLLATLVDSLLDVGASLVTFVAVRQALVPPDREHRFGHGKAEPLAALAQSAFITGSALFLLVEAIGRLFAPEPLQDPEVGYAVMGIAIGVTLALTLFQGYVARRTGSLAITADRLHYTSDLLVNAAVICALFVVDSLAWPAADPIIALAIGSFILYTAYGLAHSALDMLLDRELPDRQRQKIKTELEATPTLKGWHDLRTRASGPQIFVQLHIELDGTMPLAESHRIAEDLEYRIAEALGQAEVIIHQDPYPDAGAHPPAS